MNHAEVLRTQQINLKLSDDEQKRLDALAVAYGVSPQNVLRLLLKQASDKLAAETPAPAPKPARSPRK